MEGTHPVALARTYSGVTQKRLAKEINRSQSFVARLERFEFECEPLAEQLSTAFLRMGFRFPPAFFQASGFVGPETAITFRKRVHAPASVRNRATFYATIAASVVAPMVGRFVRYPEVDVPTRPTDWNAAATMPRLIGASVAAAVRCYWGMGQGPISDVIRLLESKGVRIFYVKEKYEHLDAFAFWSQDVPYIFLNQLQTDPARLRFDLAHELGHLVMHRDVEMDVSAKRPSLDIIENMAHGFSAEFLAPWEAFRHEVPVLPDLERLGRLRARWRISMQAIIKHMHANEAISDASYTNAFKKFSVLGYRRAPEPGWFIPDKSVIHDKFLEIVQAKGLSVANLAEEVGVSEQLLADLIPQSTEVDQFVLSPI
jgi:Zn-dependent peptidase ImmA (M78 family)